MVLSHPPSRLPGTEGATSVRSGHSIRGFEMAVFNGAFPIMQGKEDAGRAFAAATIGEQLKGFEALQAGSGGTRETWARQETPMGSFMLVWFEAPDIEKAFMDLAADEGEFAVWFRGQVLDLTGVDMAAEPEGPPPDVLVDWTA